MVTGIPPTYPTTFSYENLPGRCELVGRDLSYLGPDLVAALADLQRDDLAHRGGRPGALAAAAAHRTWQPARRSFFSDSVFVSVRRCASASSVTWWAQATCTGSERKAAHDLKEHRTLIFAEIRICSEKI